MRAGELAYSCGRLTISVGLFVQPGTVEGEARTVRLIGTDNVPIRDLAVSIVELTTHSW